MLGSKGRGRPLLGHRFCPERWAVAYFTNPAIPAWEDPSPSQSPQHGSPPSRPGHPPPLLGPVGRDRRRGRESPNSRKWSLKCEGIRNICAAFFSPSVKHVYSSGKWTWPKPHGISSNDRLKYLASPQSSLSLSISPERWLSQEVGSGPS